MNATWYLFDIPQGRIVRDPSAANLHVLCTVCGSIWARVETDGHHYWTCSHRACPACGVGSLAGADWTAKPYVHFNLPFPLLVRELDLASYFPDKYNSLS